MRDRLGALSSSRIAFLLMAFTGGICAVAWMPDGLAVLLGYLLLIASAVLFYEAWIRRWSRRRLRANLMWATLSLAAGALVLSGWLHAAATPLLALAAVCGVLGLTAMLSESGEK